MDDAQNTQLHWLRAPKLGLVLHGRKKFIFNHWRSCIEFPFFFRFSEWRWSDCAGMAFLFGMCGSVSTGVNNVS